MLILNKNILTIGGNRLEGGPLTPPEPPGPTIEEVTIGTQTWMAKNLAIDDGQGDIYSVDNVTANGINFGTQYYYTWNAAKRVANSIDGWHLPTISELNTLISYCGGTSYGAKLKSTEGWNNNGNGTDDYGFTLLPVGGYNYSDTFGNIGELGGIWSRSSSRGEPQYIYCVYNSNIISTASTSSSTSLVKHSVRLIKDT